jgi:hypothetical protein
MSFGIKEDRYAEEEIQAGRDGRQAELLSALNRHIQQSEDFNTTVQAALKNPVVPNLAIATNAARLDAAQLHLVGQRSANLKKAITLLGDSNPEWACERDHVLDDMHDTRLEISWQTVNLMSLGFAEWAKRMAKTNVADVAKNVLLKSLKESLADLPSEEARLDQIMATTKDIRLTEAI